MRSHPLPLKGGDGCALSYAKGKAQRKVPKGRHNSGNELTYFAP